MDQTKLFHDSLLDALGTAVIALGGAKKVSGELWPSLKPDTGYARMKACLSEDKPEKFSHDEIVAIARMARDIGCHVVMDYLGQELSYHVTPVDPRDDLQAAIANFEDKADQVLRAVQAVQRARVRAAS